MGVQDIGLDDWDDLVEPGLGCRHFGPFAQHRQVDLSRCRVAVKHSVIDGFLILIGLGMARRRQVMGSPAETALLGQQRQRAERIAALQRDRMIENVKNSHADQNTL